MYDNIDFSLRSSDIPGIDFLSETPCYFEVTGEHDFKGQRVISGNLDGFRISVNRAGVNIKDGSLCKYYLGDNFQTLGRGDVKMAIEKLSDALHLPINEATISRLDIAQNFIVKHPAPVYYNHLGELKYSKRAMCADSSLYYYQNNGVLIFYDKVREQRDKGRPIPELYQDSHTLRYERRYRRRLPAAFNVGRVTGALLYDERFYIQVVDQWKGAYKAIKKTNDITLNFDYMRTKRDLYTIGLLSLADQYGGELGLITQVNEAQKQGYLSKKQAFDMRQAITDACKVKEGLTMQNEAILELNKKVDEAAKFYR